MNFLCNAHQFSTILCNAQQFSTILCSAQQYSEILSNAQQLSVILSNAQQHLALCSNLVDNNNGAVVELLPTIKYIYGSIWISLAIFHNALQFLVMRRNTQQFTGNEELVEILQLYDLSLRPTLVFICYYLSLSTM